MQEVLDDPLLRDNDNGLEELSDGESTIGAASSTAVTAALPGTIKAKYTILFNVSN